MLPLALRGYWLWPLKSEWHLMLCPTNEALSQLVESLGSHTPCSASCRSLSCRCLLGAHGTECSSVCPHCEHTAGTGRWPCCRRGLDNAKFKYQGRSVEAAYLLNVSVPKSLQQHDTWPCQPVLIRLMPPSCLRKVYIAKVTFKIQNRAFLLRGPLA